MINNIKETVLNNDAFIYDEPKFIQNINNLKKHLIIILIT